MLTTHRVTGPALSRAEGDVRGHTDTLWGQGETFLDRDGKCRDTKVNRGAWGSKTTTAAGARGRRQRDFVRKSGPGSLAGFGEGSPLEPGCPPREGASAAHAEGRHRPSLTLAAWKGPEMTNLNDKIKPGAHVWERRSARDPSAAAGRG